MLGTRVWCWFSARYAGLKPAPVLSVLEMLHFSLTLVCGENMNIQTEMIRVWLFKIGESANDHNLVIDKCMRDPDAMEYFLRHALGEYVMDRNKNHVKGL